MAIFSHVLRVRGSRFKGIACSMFRVQGGDGSLKLEPGTFNRADGAALNTEL
jgi:hypothetical protein